MAKKTKYYVYTLSDPRNNEPFYVGKGKGNRINAHEKEANFGSNHPKCKIIREIKQSGLEVIKNIIKWFSNEDSAYRYESKLIKKIGRDKLTNKTDGGKGAPSWVSYDKSNKETSDMQFAKCIFLMMRKTALFTKEPIIVLNDYEHKIDKIKFNTLVQSFKNKLYEYHLTYGNEWLKEQAQKENINLSFI